MSHGIVVLACLLGAFCATAADEKDSVKEKLFAAKMAYDGEMRQYRKAAEEWFDKREDTARKAGDKKTIDLLKTERKAFDEDDTLPKTAPAFIQQKPLQAKKTLEAAYSLAVREYTKAKKDAEAAVIEAEWKAFVQGSTGPVDLMALVNLKAHVVDGVWKTDGSALVCDAGDTHGRLQLAYEPGKEYDIEVTCRRLAGKGGIAVGLVTGDRQVRAVVDGWPLQGNYTALDRVDGKGSDNVTSVKGEVMKGVKDYKITCAVRSGRIDLVVDGKLVTSFKGEFTRLGLAEGQNVPNKKALFLITSPKTTTRFDRVVVTPVKGKGNITR